MKFKPGDKVVPHNKSIGNCLEASIVWTRCKLHNQNFMYVSRYEDSIVLCNSDNSSTGDYFSEYDLTLYEEPKSLHYPDMSYYSKGLVSRLDVMVDPLEGPSDYRDAMMFSMMSSIPPREFQLGDTVRIRKDSIFYMDGIDNPKDAHGIIIQVWQTAVLPIKVRWGEKSTNSYYRKDLELIKAVEDNSKTMFVDSVYVGDKLVYGINSHQLLPKGTCGQTYNTSTGKYQQTKTMEKQKPKTFTAAGKNVFIREMHKELIEMGYQVDETFSTVEDRDICITHSKLNASNEKEYLRIISDFGTPSGRNVFFKLPSQYDECIAFAKEQLPIAKEYFKKEEEFKAGDYVLAEGCTRYSGSGAFGPCIVKLLDKNGKYNKTTSGLLRDSKETHFIVFPPGNHSSGYNINKANIIRLATPEEVSKSLLEEAHKMYPKGTSYVSVSNQQHKCIVKGELIYYKLDNDRITDGFGGCVYLDGQWATILEQKPEITISEYEGKYDNDIVKFGTCTKVHKNKWLAASNLFENLEKCGQINSF
jgi:hypothetical protein